MNIKHLNYILESCNLLLTCQYSPHDWNTCLTPPQSCAQAHRLRVHSV